MKVTPAEARHLAHALEKIWLDIVAEDAPGLVDDPTGQRIRKRARKIKLRINELRQFGGLPSHVLKASTCGYCGEPMQPNRGAYCTRVCNYNATGN